jgi:thymidylate synthase (FAD)
VKLIEEGFDQGDAKLIHYLAANEHASPYRHTAVPVRCGAPLFVASTLSKRQVGLSRDEVSCSYIDVGTEYFVPPSWRSRPNSGVKQGSGGDIEHIKELKL